MIYKLRTNQNGFSLVESLLVLIAVALVVFVGYYVWHTQKTANQTYTSASKVAQNSPAKVNKKSNSSSTTTDPYIGWKSYTDTANTYTVRYPSSWNTFSSGEHATLATDVTGIGPSGNDTLVTVSSYATSLGPKAFVTKEQNGAAVAQDRDLTINGNSAYYEETGDSNTTVAYAVGGHGRVVMVSMTLKSTIPTEVDNSQYVADFNLVAKSVELK